MSMYMDDRYVVVKCDRCGTLFEPTIGGPRAMDRSRKAGWFGRTETVNGQYVFHNYCPGCSKILGMVTDDGGAEEEKSGT